MFEFIKRIFGYGRAARAVSVGTVVPMASAPPQPTRPAMDKSVASLSLVEILTKLPPDLKAIVNRRPDPEAKFAMRVNKIMEQLPGGSVKIPFKNLRRQAPRETFHNTKIDRNRMVDLPMAEVLKAIDPSRLELNPDQAEYHIPVGVVGVFADNGEARCVVDPMIDPGRVLWMPGVSPKRTNGTGQAAVPGAVDGTYVETTA